MLIFYADTIMVMANSENSCVYNFAILLKSRKLDARDILVFYNSSLSAWVSELEFNIPYQHKHSYIWDNVKWVLQYMICI